MNSNKELLLLPCPFCGGKANIERIGTPRQSCLVACSDCGTFLETGEQGPECGGAWNRRHEMIPSAPQPDCTAQSNFTDPDVKIVKKNQPTDTEILDWLDQVSHKKANDWWVENFGTDYNHQSLREAIINAMRTE